MADKFKAGDKVRCVKFSIEGNSRFIRLNDTGVVVNAAGEGEYGQTYLVDWNDPVESSDVPGGNSWYCDEPDLELVVEN